MTTLNTDHPNHLPYIELVEEGRKISFRRDCLGDLEIFRKVNDKDEALLIKKARTPYVDEEEFPPGTKLNYSIRLEENGEEKQYELEVRL